MPQSMPTHRTWFAWSCAVLFAGALVAPPAAAVDCPPNTKEQGFGGVFPTEVACLLKSGSRQGLRHGPFERFFKSGQKREIGQYEQGAKAGTWKFWHSTGEFAGESNYVRGLQHGPFKNLDSGGSLIAEGSFFQGKKHGVWRKRNKAGAIRTSLFQMGQLVDVPTASLTCPMGSTIDEATMAERRGSSVLLTVKSCVDESGTKNGAMWTFNADGSLRVEQSFVDGVPDGRYVAWLDNGMLKMEGIYRKGKKEGLWRVFNREGTPSAEIPLKDGQKTGVLVRFHDNGMKKEEGEYKQGLPDGIFSQWSNTGTLLGNTVFVEGSGTWTTWHANGEIEEEGELVNGRRNGEWKKFKPDGWVLEKSVYANGRRISRGR